MEIGEREKWKLKAGKREKGLKSRGERLSRAEKMANVRKNGEREAAAADHE